jgi:hypothetical protein
MYNRKCYITTIIITTTTTTNNIIIAPIMSEDIGEITLVVRAGIVTRVGTCVDERIGVRSCAIGTVARGCG